MKEERKFKDKKTIKVTLHITAVLEKEITGMVSQETIKKYMEKGWDEHWLRLQVSESDTRKETEYHNPDSLELENITLEDPEGIYDKNYCWIKGDLIH
tara:strand:+ start:1937 stop:2230 length:294 start_codon:yes stop_codon:yes gene_type:complete